MPSDTQALWRKVCEKLDPEHTNPALWNSLGNHVWLSGDSMLAAIEAADVSVKMSQRVCHQYEHLIDMLMDVTLGKHGDDGVSYYEASGPFPDAVVRALAAALGVDESVSSPS